MNYERFIRRLEESKIEYTLLRFHSTTTVEVGRFGYMFDEDGNLAGGSWGLEPQTSTVSKRRDQALPTTWEALGDCLFTRNHGQAGVVTVMAVDKFRVGPQETPKLERYGVSRPKLLQSCVFRFGGNEDGDVRVCFFPEREKILIGDLGFGRIAIESVGAAKAEVGERTQREIDYHALMVSEFP